MYFTLSKCYITIVMYSFTQNLPLIVYGIKHLNLPLIVYGIKHLEVEETVIGGNVCLCTSIFITSSTMKA